MIKYNQYIKEQKAFLGMGKYGFYTNKYKNNFSDYSVGKLNNDIERYLHKTYSPFGYKRGVNSDINVGGKIINSQYIDLMVNNYTVFKRFIYDNKITNEKDFYEKISSQFDNVYHYNGDFFNRNTLPIVMNTYKKGNINERKSLNKFQEIVNKKGININIDSPTLEEDLDGIDGKFSLNGKEYTIQVKPFSSLNSRMGKFYAKSDGSLSLSVDYLILYKNNEYIILKNPKNNSIKIESQYFVYNEKNIVYSSVDL